MATLSPSLLLMPLNAPSNVVIGCSTPASSRLDAGERLRISRAVIVELLSADHDERWELGDLAGRFPDIAAPELRAVLQELADRGVIALGHNQLCAAPGARYLDQLGMVAI